MAEDIGDTSSSGSNSPEEKIRYSSFFRFNRIQGGKQGICFLCEEQKIVKIIKMKNGNTSGLKKHLQLYHPCKFDVMFNSKEREENNNLPADAYQQTFKEFLKVSVYKKYSFN